ncbi:cell division protein ZapA [Ferviditalea candida]|uniref:Cell division protein ZapA n=1 Tax=Ferviditalea candida TaxID=3108399 RepID=A0ABU5ZFW5_9BACL|nr:cell division protein ZapA [Paenibacillaceae bacterium T2]
MNSGDKTRITVDIYGMQYKLMGNSSVDHMKTVADFVNEHMLKISKNNSRLDTPRIAVLAAVNMADEYLRMKQEMERLQEDEQKKILIRNYNLLQEQYDKLQQEHRISAERLEEWKQKEKSLMEEYRALQEEHEQLKRQFREEVERLRAANPDTDALKQQLKQLKEEYGKLQNEYDEWIQLVQADPVKEQ